MSLIVTEKVLSERKKFLETLLNLIAKTPKLCCSTPVLEFLEVNKISIKQNQLKNNEAEKPKEDVKEEKDEVLEEPERDIFGISKMDNSEEESEEDDETDLGVVDMKRPTAVKQKDPEMINTTTENSDNFLKSSGKFSFGAHDDDGNVQDLFIPEEALKSNESKLFVSEDEPGLLQIDDDLDKLLNISKKNNDKKQPTPKPRAPPKPDLKPRPTPKPRFVETTSTGDDNFFSKAVVPPKPKPRTRTKPECESKTNKAVENVSPKQKTNEGTLNDIFGKESSGKNIFSGVNDDDDEDLFKPQLSENVDVDDISKYIEQNIGQTTHEEVDLFS